jgi:hypothetical protein
VLFCPNLKQIVKTKTAAHKSKADEAGVLRYSFAQGNHQGLLAEISQSSH